MLFNRDYRQPNTPPTQMPPNYIPNENQATKVNQSGAQGFGMQSQSMGPSVKAVDPGAIVPCLYRFTYIWPNRGQGFWAYPIFIGRNSIAGWRFNGRRWVYFGMDLRRIRSFYCV